MPTYASILAIDPKAIISRQAMIMPAPCNESLALILFLIQSIIFISPIF